jgi:hypothetical protein
VENPRDLQKVNCLRRSWRVGSWDRSHLLRPSLRVARLDVGSDRSVIDVCDEPSLLRKFTAH